MEKFKTNLEANGYEISIRAIDKHYDFPDDTINIPHYQDSFEFNNTFYLKKNTHNIIVTFSNDILPDNYVLYGYKNVDITNIKDYKITYIDCSGPIKDNSSLWNTGFPTNVIENIIEYDLTTPIDKNDYNSYIYAINTTKQLKQDGIFDVMKPYIIASWYILGNLMLIGIKENNYQGSDIIREVLKKINLNDHFDQQIIDDINQFIEKKIIYNNLHENTRQAFYKLVYGIEHKNGMSDFK